MFDHILQSTGCKFLLFEHRLAACLRSCKGALPWCLLGIARLMLCKIDDYKVSVLIPLSVVMGGYQFAHSMHISEPLRFEICISFPDYI